MKYKNENNIENVNKLLSKMTLDEKLAQLGSQWSTELLDGNALDISKADNLLANGVGQISRLGGATELKPKEIAEITNEIQKYLVNNTRLGIPAIFHEEACSGFMVNGATAFPDPIGLSCTWEPELAYLMGKEIKRQMRSVGTHQALAPLFDVVRDPRWGRVEEAFGEDPYLVADMGTNFVKGLQGDDLKEGVMATGKHFVGYSASSGGLNWAPSHITNRELQEVYLFPFEKAVKNGKISSIMNAYQEIDGIPCCISAELFEVILRKKWGFDGVVVSDYLAINSIADYHNLAADKKEAAILALKAGIDIELPRHDCYNKPLKEAVKDKKNNIMKYIDKSVARILEMKFRLGLFDNPFVDTGKLSNDLDSLVSRNLANKIAEKSIVLLKNESILPISRKYKKLAVIGPCADNKRSLIGDYSYIANLENVYESKGRTANDFFTSIDGKIIEIESVPIISYLDAISEIAGEDYKINYAKGCGLDDDSTVDFSEALDAVEKSDIALIFVGDKCGITTNCSCGESRDSANIQLPGTQKKLISKISEIGKPIVLILSTGRPYALGGIIEKVDAIIETWKAGEEGGTALANILFGKVNPSGKLTMTFPVSAGQIPIYYSHKPSGSKSFWHGNYTDISVKPAFVFGHGLSYTKFEYSDLNISPRSVIPGDMVEISFNIKNTGKVDGDEVVQIYTRNITASVTRPVKELKGYSRINLKQGEKKRITFKIPIHCLAFLDKNMKLVVEKCAINVMIGASSEDIRLDGRFEISRRKQFSATCTDDTEIVITMDKGDEVSVEVVLDAIFLEKNVK